MKWVHTPFNSLPGFLGQIPVAQLLAALCAPIFLIKNIINVVQLWKASKILVGVDLAERAKARDSKS